MTTVAIIAVAVVIIVVEVVKRLCVIESICI